MNIRIESSAVSASSLYSCAAVAHLDFYDGATVRTFVVSARGPVDRVPDIGCAEAEGSLLGTELLISVLKVCRYL